jgi:ribosomal protein L17
MDSGRLKTIVIASLVQSLVVRQPVAALATIFFRRQGGYARARYHTVITVPFPE